MPSTAVLPGGVSIAYTYRPPSSASSPLVIFINGLRMPASGWAESIAMLSKTQAYLVYDRPGQFEGESPPLPPDSGTHEIPATADQLASLLGALKVPRDQKLVLVSNSIGCIIARIFSSAATYTRVVAHLFLDSNISNTDFVSLLPAPSESEPPELARTRDTLRKLFHPSVPNGEKLDRSTVPRLMPSASEPKPPGQPCITIVGHDPVAFLEGGAKIGMDAQVVATYVEPAWQAYNAGLAQLTTPERCRGPLVAKGADHFIQRDRPDLVAEEIRLLVGLVERTGAL